MWFNQSVARLRRFGYGHDEIGDMTIPQFTFTLDAVEQVEAADRINLVTDITTVASGMYAEKGKSPISDHIGLLNGVRTGDKPSGDE